MPTPFDVGPANICVLGQGPFTVVDVGPKHPDTIRVFTRELDRLGCKFDDIDKIVITHPHPDHYGLAAWLKQKSGAIVLAHPYTAWRVSGRYTGDGFESLRPIMANLGIPEPVANSFINRDDDIERWLDPVLVDVIVEDCQYVDLGGQKWQVIYTPGHSRGHICLYNPDTKALISGDHVLPRISSNPIIEPPLPGETGIPETLKDYRRSLERTEKLEVSSAYPGHGPVFNNVGLRINTIFEHHRRQKTEVLKSVDRNGMTVFEVSRRVFPDLKGMKVFFGVCLVMGQLDILADEGLVEFSGENPLIVTKSEQKRKASL